MYIVPRLIIGITHTQNTWPYISKVGADECKVYIWQEKAKNLQVSFFHYRRTHKHTTTWQIWVDLFVIDEYRRNVGWLADAQLGKEKLCGTSPSQKQIAQFSAILTSTLHLVMNAASDNNDNNMGNNSINNADAEYEDLDENDKLETRLKL